MPPAMVVSGGMQDLNNTRLTRLSQRYYAEIKRTLYTIAFGLELREHHRHDWLNAMPLGRRPAEYWVAER